MRDLTVLLKKISPYYGVTHQTSWNYLAPHLKKRQEQKRNCSFEGDWQKKLDLNHALPRVFSALAFAFPYPFLVPKLLNLTLSAYTCVKDYHKVVLSYLQTGVKDLKTLYPNHDFLCLVDSGKVLEKEIALSAGLGFRGKNSLIINPLLGSYFFIGVILTTASIPKVFSHSLKLKGCKDCQRCIQACPAKALDNNGLNASLCISYLNQNKKEALGNWHNFLWGCDLCQMVCPYNLKPLEKPLKDFSFRFDLKLLQANNLTNLEFDKVSKALPLKWGKKKLIVRNLQFLAKNRENVF